MVKSLMLSGSDFSIRVFYQYIIGRHIVFNFMTKFVKIVNFFSM